ncbi:MAG: chitinase [Prevotellaceae bacterium]|nr:chitinase [Prevotellaceae bacterium]
MKSKAIVFAACCMLMLAQCATLRQSEVQSWKSSRDSWNSSYSGTTRQGVNDEAALREGQQTTGAAKKSSKRQQQRRQPPKGKKQSGKLSSSSSSSPSSSSSSSVQEQHAEETLGGVMDEEMWDELFPNRLRRGVSGESDFYSFAALVAAAKHFPRFLHEGSELQRRRELAAFLAHLSQETGGFRYLEQITVTRSYSVDNKEYPPVDGKDYRGRGPMQLSYNYNYGQFSSAYFGDKNVLLNNPELLATDSVASFGSAIWFWMTMQSPKPSCHDVMVGNWQPGSMDIDANRLPGFGLTLNIINASQCGKASEHAQKRYDIYDRYCKYFGATKGDACECTDQLPYGKKSF